MLSFVQLVTGCYQLRTDRDSDAWSIGQYHIRTFDLAGPQET